VVPPRALLVQARGLAQALEEPVAARVPERAQEPASAQASRALVPEPVLPEWAQVRETAARPASAVLELAPVQASARALPAQAQPVLQPSVPELRLALAFSRQAPRARGEGRVSAQQPQALGSPVPAQAQRRPVLTS
jgi:hypothetical protein